MKVIINFKDEGICEFGVSVDGSCIVFECSNGLYSIVVDGSGCVKKLDIKVMVDYCFDFIE